MKALIFPTKDLIDDSLIKALADKGHTAFYEEDKERFLKKFKDCDLVLATGNLTTLGVWLWGYSYASRKRVVVITGVNPCIASRTISLEKWLESLPTQLSLFPEDPS